MRRTKDFKKALKKKPKPQAKKTKRRPVKGTKPKKKKTKKAKVIALDPGPRDPHVHEEDSDEGVGCGPHDEEGYF